MPDARIKAVDLKADPRRDGAPPARWTPAASLIFALSGLAFAGLTAVSAGEPMGGAMEGTAGKATGDDPHAHHLHAAMEPAYYSRTLHEYGMPDVELTDMDGSKVALGESLSPDRPLFLSFIFTSCKTICPVLSATFAQVQRDLDRQQQPVALVSISIDPEQDTPERLKDYALRYHPGEHWRFLTGNLADIQRVQKAFDAYRGEKMSHVPLTFFRASSEAPWVRIEGFASAADLIAEYRRIADTPPRQAAR